MVAAVIAEAHVDPAEIYTAADLEAAHGGLVAARAPPSVRWCSAWSAAWRSLLGGIFALERAGGLVRHRESTTIDLRPTGRIVDVEGTIVVEPLDAGLSIELESSPLPDVGGGGSYLAVVVLDDGTIVPAGSFLGGDDDDRSSTLWAAVPRRHAAVSS